MLKQECREIQHRHFWAAQEWPGLGTSQEYGLGPRTSQKDGLGTLLRSESGEQLVKQKGHMGTMNLGGKPSSDCNMAGPPRGSRWDIIWGDQYRLTNSQLTMQRHGQKQRQTDSMSRKNGTFCVLSGGIGVQQRGLAALGILWVLAKIRKLGLIPAHQTEWPASCPGCKRPSWIVSMQASMSHRFHF